MKERIINNVRMLYSLDYVIFDGQAPKSQSRATADIINMFSSTPFPVSADYMLENTSTDALLMVTITREGYIAMREPTAKEIDDYLSELHHKS